MDLGLKNRRALVTAATEGLGLAIAVRLADEGAQVAVTGRRGERVAEVAASLSAGFGFVGDLSNDGVAVDMVEQAAAVLGGLDVVIVNTAGAHPGGLLDKSRDEDDNAYLNLLRPALSAARAAAPHLRRSEAGRLVFITARSILETTPDLALSGVFRSGVAAAARVLADELAPDVLVNVVVPGQFDTGGLHRFEAFLAEREGMDTARGPSATRVTDSARPSGRSSRAGRCGGVPGERPRQLHHRKRHSGRWRSDARVLRYDGLHFRVCRSRQQTHCT